MALKNSTRVVFYVSNGFLDKMKKLYKSDKGIIIGKKKSFSGWLYSILADYFNKNEYKLNNEGSTDNSEFE